MHTSVSDILLQQASDFVASQFGLHFPKERWRDLERGIKSAGNELGFKSVESCVEWMLSKAQTKNQMEILASHLTIGETYFFREKESLDILTDSILPELIYARQKGDKHLRIWSAACSTGEEPYSIAILLDKIIPDIKNWQITITATDINVRSLHKASEGIYGEWSFRGIPKWIKDKYFEKKGGKRFEISKRIKKMVTFSYLNLVEDVYPSLLNNTNGMDVILCRNVLMYFTPEQVSKVVERFKLSLVSDGWLIVSPVDVSCLFSPHFLPVRFPNATLYRKENNSRYEIEKPLTSYTTEWEASPTQLLPEPVIIPPIEVLSYSDTVKSTSSELVDQSTLNEEALALYEQGLYTDVINRILTFEPLSENDSTTLSLLARAYANQGKLADAFVWCKKAVANEKTNPALHYLLAVILQEQGQIAKAVESLKRALFLDYDFVLAHFALGNLSRQQGKLKESGKHLQNALEILNGLNIDDVLPESEGITAGRLIEVINSMNY